MIVIKVSLGNCQKKMALVLVMVALVLGIYWQVRDYGFVYYDDYNYVAHNYSIQTGLSLQSILHAFTDIRTANWHPLTMLSHALDWQLFGDKAGGHHWTNLVMHILNTILLFILLNAMTGAVWRSAVVAALFGVHPINVESIAWVAERKNVLSTFFWILTMLSYVWYVQKPGWKRYLPVLLCFALGLMSKPMLVTLPFVLLLMDYWPLGRTGLKARGGVEMLFFFQAPKVDRRFLLMEKIPLFILTALFAAVTFYTQKNAGAVVGSDQLPLLGRIWNGVYSYGLYVRKLFWPFDLSVFYPRLDINFGGLLFGMLVLVSFSVLAVWNYQRKRYLIVGWLWFLGTLVPVIGLVQVGNQAMADRYAYIPFIGLFMLFVWFGAELVQKNHLLKQGLIIVSCLFVLGLSVVAWQRCQLWGNQIALWTDALKYNKSAFLYNFRGMAYEDQGQYQLAFMDYHQAIRFDKTLAEAYNNRGNLYLKIGRFEQAMKDYNKAQQVQPSYVNTYYNRGLLYLSIGRWGNAIDDFTAFIKKEPLMPDIYYHRGRAFLMKGEYEKSLLDLKRALLMNPASVSAYCSRGELYTLLGKKEEAINDFQSALRIEQSNEKILSKLASLLKQMKRYEESSVYLRRILQIHPNDQNALENLREMDKLISRKS